MSPSNIQQGGSYEDYVGCINTYFGPNKVDFGTEMIAAYGACVGVSCPFLRPSCQ